MSGRIEVNLPAPLISVDLELPPAGLSPNARRASARIAKSRAVRAYREAAGWAFVAAYRSTGRGPLDAATVRATFYFPDRRRRDADNAAAALKPVWDGLQDAGVVRDDSALIHLPPTMAVDRTRPRLTVEVFDVELVFAGGAPDGFTPPPARGFL